MVAIAASVVVVLGIAAAVIGLGRNDTDAAGPAARTTTPGASSASSATPTVDAEAASDLAKAKARKAKQVRQAKQLASIAADSASARTDVKLGIAKARTCSDPSGGVARLQSAISTRAGVLGRLAGADASALPAGKALISDLEDAQRESLAADQAYLGWAQNLANFECSYYEGYDGYDLTDTALYQDGVGASAEAQRAKKRFLEKWDVVVRLTGVRRFTAADI